MDNPDTPKTQGELAYSAYGATTNYLNYQGLPMPAWPDLPEKIREAWENAASVVASAATSRPPVADPAWFGTFDDRQQNQIRFARIYARDFRHGADGHNNMLIIAAMAELLDASERRG